jgi:hypothetical protein
MTTPALFCLLALLSADAPQAQPKLALLPFRVLRMPADLGLALDSHLAGAVDARDKYALVTTQDINAMLGLERMKDAASCTDTACAVDIGGALGADLMLSPQATALGDMVEITITLIDVRHATVLGRKQGRVPRDEKFLARGIDEAVEHLLGPGVAAPKAPNTMPLLITTEDTGGYSVEADVGRDKYSCDHAVTPTHACALAMPNAEVKVIGRSIDASFRTPLQVRLNYMPDGYTVKLSGSGNLGLVVIGGLGVSLGFLGMVGSTIGFVLGGEGTGFAVLGTGVALVGLGTWGIVAGVPSDHSTVTPGVPNPALSLNGRWTF